MMQYELNILIDVDDENNTSSLSIKGTHTNNEECNLLFTNNKVARSLYNKIVYDIYSAANSTSSDVYEIKNGLDGDEDAIKSMNIRKGKFVSEFEELDRFLKDQTYKFKGGYINPSNDISNPSHYTEGRKYEPRKVIEDWDLDWNLGNAVKYISRAGRKDDPVKDLKKARKYLDWAIEERSRFLLRRPRRKNRVYNSNI